MGLCWEHFGFVWEIVGTCLDLFGICFLHVCLLDLFGLFLLLKTHGKCLEQFGNILFVLGIVFGQFWEQIIYVFEHVGNILETNGQF